MTQRVRGEVERYLPKSDASRALLVAGASAVYNYYQRSWVGYLVTGAVVAGAIGLSLKKRSFDPVHLDKGVSDLLQAGSFYSGEELEGIHRDMERAFNEGTFLQTKPQLVSRVNALRKTGPKLNGGLSKAVYNRVHTFPIKRNVEKLTKALALDDAQEMIFSFLTPDELARTNRVSPDWHRAVSFSDHAWKNQYRSLVCQPKRVCLEEEIFYTQASRNLYPRIFGKQFYEGLGVEVGEVPPLTDAALSKADYFVFVPEYLTLESATIGLDGEGRLVKLAQPLARKKTIRFPLTLNNVLFVFRERFQRDLVTGLDEESWTEILQQHGNTHFPTHWSCQKKDLLGKGLTLAEQSHQADREGLEVVPLLDRLLCNLFVYLRTKNFVDTDFAVARTSTGQLSLMKSYPLRDLDLDLDGHNLVVEGKPVTDPAQLMPQIQIDGFPHLEPKYFGAAVAVKNG
jgi:hypothetical protein